MSLDDMVGKIVKMISIPINKILFLKEIRVSVQFLHTSDIMIVTTSGFNYNQACIVLCYMDLELIKAGHSPIYITNELMYNLNDEKSLMQERRERFQNFFTASRMRVIIPCFHI